MARDCRVRSDNGFYHIISRSQNLDVIFEDDYDYKTYLEILKKEKENYNILIYAYCLMSNHTHLIVKQQSAPVEMFMKVVTMRYAYYFNKKKGRFGSVFMGRYISEPIEGETHYKELLRYILQNPVAEKIVFDATKYLYSSVLAYILPYSGVVDIDYTVELFKDENGDAKTRYLKYISEKNTDFYKDINNSKKTKALKKLKQEKTIWNYTIENYNVPPTEVSKLNSADQEKIWCELFELRINMKTIAAATGCEYFKVYKELKKKKSS